MSTPTPSTEPSIASRMGIMQLWRRLVGTADAASANASAEPLDKRQWQKIDALLQEATSRADSDTRVRARARRLLDAYQKANAQDRLAFMLRLAQGFHIDEAALEVAIAHWQQAARSGNAADKLHAQTRLAQTLESPRMHILRQFNLLPAGIEALVRMRAELLGLREHQQALQPLESDLLRLLTLWFDAGFLELQRIGWSSPASLLEKVIRYEAVHEIKSWDDLRNRLDSDRRCYAFFHGRMPEEPLIFVEVALVQSLASSVQALLDEAQPTNDPTQATTAIFYSISNAQPGLRGVSMGEFLIKRVVEQLTHEFPKLQTFATLSPVPGFGQWLRTQLADAAYVQQLPAIAQRALADHATAAPTDTSTDAAAPATTADTAYERLQTLLATHEANAHPREEEVALKQWLMGECAHYLLMQKRKQEPLDAVARFHFGNGASLQQINWMGDSSAKGLRQSLGLMVNYLYRLDAIDEQYHAYARQGLLAHSSEVKKLLAATPIRREG